MESGFGFNSCLQTELCNILCKRNSGHIFERDSSLSKRVSKRNIPGTIKKEKLKQNLKQKERDLNNR